MAVFASCFRCGRAYGILGAHFRHFRTMMPSWTCPRCKRGRNLPRWVSPDDRPLAIFRQRPTELGQNHPGSAGRKDP